MLVLGLARSGVAAAAALERRGVEVVRAGREQGNEDDLSLLNGIGLLVKSPGVPGEAALVAEARQRGVKVWSEVELGSHLLPNPILGVTGTNGKTTTAEWLGFILDAPVARAAAVAAAAFSRLWSPRNAGSAGSGSVAANSIRAARPATSKPLGTTAVSCSVWFSKMRSFASR